MARESQTSRARDTADPVANMTTDEAARLPRYDARSSSNASGRAVRAQQPNRPRSPHETASGALPLSASQAQLWYLSQLAPDSFAFNELIEIRKTGPLDVEALHRALSAVVSRHEAWRTTFACVDGVPHQFVHEPIEIDLPLVDLSHLSTDQAKHRAIEIATADTQWPYDLAHEPLIRHG
jgi:hypothetical protein